MRLTPNGDGTVHHVIETSSDAGKNWSVAFDAVYKPAKSTAAKP